MRNAVTLLLLFLLQAVRAYTYDMALLSYDLVKTFESGQASDDQLAVLPNAAQAGGAVVGPDKMVVSTDGKWIYIADPWQMRHKYFNSALDFRFAWDTQRLGSFVPEMIIGDIAYGTSFEPPDRVVLSVVDLARRLVLSRYPIHVSYSELRPSPFSIRKSETTLVFAIYVRPSELILCTFNFVDGTFMEGERTSVDAAEYRRNTKGVGEWQDEPFGTNDYAEKNRLVVSDTRQYFGEYRGKRIWISTMSPRRPDGSSQPLLRLFGPTDPETLFVLMSENDARGTPLKGFYLPPLKYYQYFDPLLAFDSNGAALLMYVDDATKRAHILQFDLDTLFSQLSDTLGHGSGLPTASGSVASYISSSSTLTQQNDKNAYHPARLFDGDPKTMWIENAKGPGIGESITVGFDAPITTDEIQFMPGAFWKEYWKQNYRVKSLEVKLDDKVFTVSFKDEMTVQSMKLTSPVTFKTAVFTIKNVYPTTKWEDTAISESTFYNQGAKVEVDYSKFKEFLKKAP